VPWPPPLSTLPGPAAWAHRLLPRPLPPRRFYHLCAVRYRCGISPVHSDIRKPTTPCEATCRSAVCHMPPSSPRRWRFVPLCSSAHARILPTASRPRTSPHRPVPSVAQALPCASSPLTNRTTWRSPQRLYPATTCVLAPCRISVRQPLPDKPQLPPPPRGPLRTLHLTSLLRRPSLGLSCHLPRPGVQWHFPKCLVCAQVFKPPCPIHRSIDSSTSPRLPHQVPLPNVHSSHRSSFFFDW
jgi:hypothetical protein